MQKAYLDGDVLLYKALTTTQCDFDGVAVGDLIAARPAFDREVEAWMTGLKRYQPIIVLSSREKTFRYSILPEYKAGRPSKPPFYGELREWVEDTYEVLCTPTLEADDVIGLLCSSNYSNLAVSIDKDMKTLPCMWKRPGDPILRIEEDEADLNWLIQSLTGDSTDGYKGLPGIGPKKAEKILHSKAPIEILWSAYVSAYEERGHTEADAIRNARLARILRKGEFDESTREVLWAQPARCTEAQLLAAYSPRDEGSGETDAPGPYIHPERVRRKPKGR